MAEIAFDDFAVVELMGHRRRVGRVAEVEMFGAKMLKVDFQEDGADRTEFYSGSSIYCLTPVTEAFVQAERERAARYTVRRLGLPAPEHADEEDGEEDRDSEPEVWEFNE